MGATEKERISESGPFSRLERGPFQLPSSFPRSLSAAFLLALFFYQRAEGLYLVRQRAERYGDIPYILCHSDMLPLISPSDVLLSVPSFAGFDTGPGALFLLPVLLLRLLRLQLRCGAVSIASLLPRCSSWSTLICMRACVCVRVYVLLLEAGAPRWLSARSALAFGRGG